MGVAAGAVDGEDECLVFDCASDGECSPVLLACVGPVCADGEDVCAALHGDAEEFGESEVVADDGGDGEVVCGVVCDNLVTGGECFWFAAEGEGVNFGVFCDFLAGRVVDAHQVEGEGVGRVENRSPALDVCVM